MGLWFDAIDPIIADTASFSISGETEALGRPRQSARDRTGRSLPKFLSKYLPRACSCPNCLS